MPWGTGGSGWGGGSSGGGGGGAVSSVSNADGTVTVSPTTGAVVVSLPAVGTAGTVGDASHSVSVTTDAQGRVSAISAVAIAIAESQVTNLVSDLAAKAPLVSPSFTTPSLGVATATSINGLVITTTTGTLTIANGKTLTANSTLTLAGTDGKTLTVNASLTLAGTDGKTLTISNSLTFAGTDGTTFTFPGSSDTVVTLGATQTLTSKTLTAPAMTNPAATLAGTADLWRMNLDTVTVTSNAGTCSALFEISKFTNSSAATMTITLSTANSPTDGQKKIVQVRDASAVAQTISWVNTENSSVTVPATSNGSTTLPLTVTFIWNASTSKWRCVGFA